MARVKFFKNQGILSLLLIVMVVFSMIPKVKAWTEGKCQRMLCGNKRWLTFVLADFEIFDIVDALEKAEGKDTNFYNWLGVAVRRADFGYTCSMLTTIEIAFSNSK